MKEKNVVRKRLMGSLIALMILGTGCGRGQNTAKLYLDESLPATPVTIFTQNQTVSVAIEECCKNVLNRDDKTNIEMCIRDSLCGGPAG